MPSDEEYSSANLPKLAPGLNHLAVFHKQPIIFVVGIIIELPRRPFKGVQIKNLHLSFNIVEFVELGKVGHSHQVEIPGDHTVVEIT